tara:strand:+ start:1604 stop:2716 length:1113 start_codon:yes stop_codon:yes gene_type:complete
MKKIKKVHLVYPFGEKISTPDAIGKNLKNFLEKKYNVKTYNYDAFEIINPGDADVLLGHWHPNPFTVFRLSAKKKGWKRILALAPFCPDPKGWHNAFGDSIIENCDLFLAITGSYWIKQINNSLFKHWGPKILHLDLAVDRKNFPVIKNNFHPIKKRRFLYIGNTSWCKNISFLEELAKKLPEVNFSWIGGDQTLEKINGLGKLDFSKKESKDLIKEFDFLIHVASADGNPTTILEAMAWGLIPVCSVQSGYEETFGIRNISNKNIDEAVETIKNLQLIPEGTLNKWKNENLKRLDNHFNWNRFCSQVINEIEKDSSPKLSKITNNKRSLLRQAGTESYNYWLRPTNFYQYIKANLKYKFQKIVKKIFTK